MNEDTLLQPSPLKDVDSFTTDRAIMDTKEYTKPLESLDYQAPDTTKRTEPNKNIVVIQKVQGLISEAWSELFNIKPVTDKQKAILGIAKEEINTYETMTLKELQSEFE